MKGANSKGVATERSPTIRVTRGDALRNLSGLVTDLGEKEGLLGLGENPNQKPDVGYMQQLAPTPTALIKPKYNAITRR